MSLAIAMEFMGKYSAVMPAQDKNSPLTSMLSEKPTKPRKKKTKKKESSKRANSKDQRGRTKSITGAASTTQVFNASITQDSASTNSWSSSEARSTGASSAENLAVSTSSSSFSVVSGCLTSQELSPTRSRQRAESLRWCTECDNSDDEAERIRVYKQNRRKRYTTFLQERADTAAVICQKNNHACSYGLRDESSGTY